MELSKQDIILRIYNYFENLLEPGDYVYDKDIFIGICADCEEIVRSKRKWFKKSDICIKCSKTKIGVYMNDHSKCE